MIFSAPRFVVVDDKVEHLNAIVKTFQELGTPCLGIHYKQEEGVEDKHFRGVRCLFMDLHLVNTQISTDYKLQYSTIAGILEDVISKNGGPYVLVLWTEQSHACDGLRDYLNDNFDDEKPHVRPLAVISLSKETFITTVDGSIRDIDSLKKAVVAAINESPQLAALLSWESDVLKAAGDTLASLLQLVPSENRTVQSFSHAVDVLLSRLAQETVGLPHVENNKRTGVTSALAPILIDRILNQEISPESNDVWSRAVTCHGKDLPAPSSFEAGSINRMLHVAIPGGESIRSTDWGAVVAWPFAWSDEELSAHTSLSIKQLCCEEFKLRSSAIDACKAMLVRVGAVCDYAQDNRGPITYLLAVEVPVDAEKQAVKASDAIWQSPVFISPSRDVPVSLFVHIRFPFTLLKKDCEGWQAAYRIREQLFMQLITSASNYAARPGIVRLAI